MFRFITGIIICLSLSGCHEKYSYFMVGGIEENREMRTLLTLLETEEGENRFILIHQISNLLLNAGELEKLVLFLTTYVEMNPNDPYNAYYLGVAAEAYKDMDAQAMVIHYYERILKNYPDLLISGRSIHYRCLHELVNLVDDPWHKIEYYKELIARFSDNIEPGITYYFLAAAYEDAGEWDQAIRTYQKVLKYPDIEIPGFSQAHAKIKQMIAFYYSSKEWTVDNLEHLVSEVKRAIRARDTRRLLRYKAGVNFYTISWSQAEADDTAALIFDIGAFLHKSRVIADDKLDIDSNEGEAFLRTSGWSYRLRTWYLYFRKVNYKPDPEINGRWEWAGIYFGEKL